MEFIDLIIAPLVALIILSLAILIRPFVTYEENRKYFLPALIFKLVGAVLLGVLYQFYYGGGDTFGYYAGATHIFDAFYDQPGIGLKLIFSDNDYANGVYNYASRIWMYRDPTAYMVVRIAGIFAILTGGTYTGTAMLFGVVSFSGLWAMYMAFCKLFPYQIFGLALAILFIPSTIFWGSGILKDSITFGMLGWSTAALINLLYWRRRSWLWTSVLIFSLVLAFNIKEYIVLSFFPAAMIWAYFIIIRNVSNKLVRTITAPFVMILMMSLSVYTVYKVGENSPRYSISNITETARVTAYDIGRWTGKGAGSRYDLGDFEGNLTSMIRLAPAAINVSLYRPYLWEVRNPLMLLASLEGLVLLTFTIIILYRMIRFRINVLNSPAAWFSLIFSLTFAFAVGISTYNFGTLFRYKVPLMPFFAILLVLAWSRSQHRDKRKGEIKRSLEPQL
jgi:hypothetical protein